MISTQLAVAKAKRRHARKQPSHLRNQMSFLCFCWTYEAGISQLNVAQPHFQKHKRPTQTTNNLSFDSKWRWHSECYDSYSWADSHCCWVLPVTWHSCAINHGWWTWVWRLTWKYYSNVLSITTVGSSVLSLTTTHINQQHITVASPLVVLH